MRTSTNRADEGPGHENKEGRAGEIRGESRVESGGPERGETRSRIRDAYGQMGHHEQGIGAVHQTEGAPCCS